jgi:hypothetical protein
MAPSIGLQQPNQLIFAPTKVSNGLWSKLLLGYLFIYVIHLAVNLERLLFVNEIFTLGGGIAALISLRNAKSSRIDRTNLIFLAYFFYTISQLFYGIFLTDVDPYLFFRTTPIVYSAAGYFLGRHMCSVIDHAPKIFKKIPKLPLFIISLLIGMRITAAASFLLLLSNSKNYLKTGLIVFTVYFLVSSIHMHDNDMTCLLIIAFLALASFTTRKMLDRIIRLIFNRAFLLITFLLVIISLRWAHETFKDFYILGYAVFAGTADGNTIWRLMFWAMTIFQVSTDYPLFGIGIGTPIYDYYDPATIFISRFGSDDDMQPYTLGLHNSFLDIYVRFGAAGLVLFILLLTNSIQRAARLSVQSDTIYLFLLVMIIFIIGATFNVVLLSPLMAAPFWMTLGILNKLCEDLSKKAPARSVQE